MWSSFQLVNTLLGMGLYNLHTTQFAAKIFDSKINLDKLGCTTHTINTIELCARCAVE